MLSIEKRNLILISQIEKLNSENFKLKSENNKLLLENLTLSNAHAFKLETMNLSRSIIITLVLLSISLLFNFLSFIWKGKDIKVFSNLGENKKKRNIKNHAQSQPK